MEQHDGEAIYVINESANAFKDAAAVILSYTDNFTQIPATLGLQGHPYALKIYCVLDRLSRANPECFISNKALAQQCGLSEPTIIKHRRWLVEHGFLEMVPGKQQQATTYKLPFKARRPALNEVYTSPALNEIDPLALNHIEPSDFPALNDVYTNREEEENSERERESQTPSTRTRGPFQRKEKVKASAAPLCKRCETRHWSTQPCPAQASSNVAAIQTAKIGPPPGMEELTLYLNKHFLFDQGSEAFWGIARAAKERGIDLEEQSAIYLQNCTDNKRSPMTSGLMSWLRNANPPRRSNAQSRRPNQRVVGARREQGVRKGVAWGG